jgi:hypothetical protein
VEGFPEQLRPQLTWRNLSFGRSGDHLIPDGLGQPQIPPDGFPFRPGRQCRNLHRCRHWWPVEAIEYRLHEVAEPLHVVFKPIEPLHCASVEWLHCTGVDTRHCTGVWSLHCGLHWSEAETLKPFVEGCPGETGTAGNLPLGKAIADELAEVVIGDVHGQEMVSHS